MIDCIESVRNSEVCLFQGRYIVFVPVQWQRTSTAFGKFVPLNDVISKSDNCMSLASGQVVSTFSV